ncbi:phosphoribosylanthranilate isomerase [Silanimonas sp.]|uniref:phosphoribosylanthranilate isomerase n=1 Tax=Silanimonas sp. TaxID=1929290 RepID=UPI001BC2D77C|nr:phosphoribosylanthranilate isomerase [Silanimonas sp.]MBS3895731.1 phosphoribosylanthranilate isomerase [Silanimonas sp.]MBS3924759.1 phosphoribosylanthranilate isomerase [Xanthomonadaceae bacterium]
MSQRTRIKFCGLTRAGDVRLAGELGVDALGFIFVPGSPRALTLAQALALRQAVPPLVQVVALFMDPDRARVHDTLRALRPTLLQFHGREDASFCASFGLPYVKTLPMGEGVEAAEGLATRYPSAEAFLLDGHKAGEPGGQGVRFDWARLPTLPKPWLLAGGLGPGNIFEAVRAARPFGVDVSSGIEGAPGLKDGERMHRFVQEVRRADGCIADS